MINNFLNLFELLSNQKANDQDSIDLSRFYISKKKRIGLDTSLRKFADQKFWMRNMFRFFRGLNYRSTIIRTKPS